MLTFKYEGRDQLGHLVKGTVEAETQNVAVSQLMSKRIIPLKVTQTNAALSFKALANFEIIKKSVNKKHLVVFCQQMQAMLSAGVPIKESLFSIIRVTDSSTLKETLQNVLVDIESGLSLSNSFKKYPNVFPFAFTSIIAAREAGGRMDEGFRQLAEYYLFEINIMDKVKSASYYPAIVFVVLFLAMFVAVYFILPKYFSAMQFAGVEIPLITRIMVGFVYFINNHKILLVLMMVGFVAAIRYIVKTKQGRYAWDYLKLKIPVFGSIFYRVNLARFARIFAANMAAGIPLGTSIELVSKVIDNTYMEKGIEKIRYRLERGEGFVASMRASKLFSTLVLQMVEIGEKTGEIESMLDHVAETYEREVTFDLNRLAELLQPILILILGGMVLIFALAMFAPHWAFLKGIMK